MEQNARTTLSFSEPYLKAEMIENVKNYNINSNTVVINSGEKEIIIEGKPLRPWQTAVFQNININTADLLICITANLENHPESKYPFTDKIIKSWNHVYDIFPLPHLKERELWRSDKHKIGKIELNLWFASAGTHCGIHNEHNFKEIHTQIYGIGRMQKFHENSYESLYQDVYMSPGFTHEPFYNEQGLYPWHQYLADTECIWLAIEFYK